MTAEAALALYVFRKQVKSESDKALLRDDFSIWPPIRAELGAGSRT